MNRPEFSGLVHYESRASLCPRASHPGKELEEAMLIAIIPNFIPGIHGNYCKSMVNPSLAFMVITVTFSMLSSRLCASSLRAVSPPSPAQLLLC